MQLFNLISSITGCHLKAMYSHTFQWTAFHYFHYKLVTLKQCKIIFNFNSYQRRYATRPRPVVKSFILLKPISSLLNRVNLFHDL